MKNLSNINLFLVIALVLTSFGSYSMNEPTIPAPEKDNILVVKGEILNNVETTISVFYLDKEDGNWVLYETSKTKKKYSLMLNSKTHYQVWYQGENGYTKQLFIEGGESGIWQMNLIINYDALEDLYAYAYQFNPSESFYTSYYKIEGIDLEEAIHVKYHMEELEEKLVCND
jgi:hypothetical protein